MKEDWEPIEGYNNYQISNFGRIRKWNRDDRAPAFHYLHPKVEKNQYLRVNLSKGGKSKFYSVHRLVAKAFLPNPSNYRCVNHKDENRQNNCVDNLEWCSHKYNSNYKNAKKRMSDSAKKRAVNQYDLNMNLINTFRSITEACNVTGANRRYVSQCCKETYRTSNGFYWRYVE